MMEYLRFLPFFCFALIWIIEYSFPRQPSGGRQHDIANILIGIANALCFSLVGRYWLRLLIETTGNASFSLNLLLPLNNLGKIIYAFIFLDLYMYLWHRAAHHFNFLFSFHQVHHTDRRMNVSTSVRFHPGEIFISYFFRGVFGGLLGLSLEGVVIFEIVSPIMIYFHHSNIILNQRLDKFLSFFIITPRLHQFHHSLKEKECQSNFGVVLSLWDIFFRSRFFKIGGDIHFGISGLPSGDTLKSYLLLPFATRKK